MVSFLSKEMYDDEFYMQMEAEDRVVACFI